MYSCEHCSYTTDVKSNLTRHLNKKKSCYNITAVVDTAIKRNERDDGYIIENDRYCCVECKKSYTTKHNFRIHNCTGKELNILQCNYCEKFFSSASSKSRHKKNCPKRHEFIKPNKSCTAETTAEPQHVESVEPAVTPKPNITITNKPSTGGYIYIAYPEMNMRANGTRYVKIGKTINSDSLYKRYKTCFGNEVVLRIFGVEDCHTMEREIFKEFKEYKIEQELYDADCMEEVIQFVLVRTMVHSAIKSAVIQESTKEELVNEMYILRRELKKMRDDNARKHSRSVKTL